VIIKFPNFESINTVVITKTRRILTAAERIHKRERYGVHIRFLE